MASCFFPGSQLFKLTQNLENVTKEVERFASGAPSGWLTDYNIRNNYSHAMRIAELLDDMPKFQFAVTDLMQNALVTAYCDHFGIKKN